MFWLMRYVKEAIDKEWNQKLIDDCEWFWTKFRYFLWMWSSQLIFTKKLLFNWSLLLIVISLVLSEGNSMKFGWLVEFLIRTIESLPDWISFLHTTTMVFTLCSLKLFASYLFVITSTILLRRPHLIRLPRFIWLPITTTLTIISLNPTFL